MMVTGKRHPTEPTATSCLGACANLLDPTQIHVFLPIKHDPCTPRGVRPPSPYYTWGTHPHPGPLPFSL